MPVMLPRTRMVASLCQVSARRGSFSHSMVNEVITFVPQFEILLKKLQTYKSISMIEYNKRKEGYDKNGYVSYLYYL